MKDPREVIRRLHAHSVRNEHGCLLYQLALDPAGYAAISVDGRKRNGHRVAWEAAHGSIGAGMCVHHAVCSRRSCCEVSHLVLVTRSVNSSIQLPRAPKKYCARGHPLTNQNVIRSGTSKRRRCRICRTRYNAAWMRAYRARERALAPEKASVVIGHHEPLSSVGR